MYERISYGHTSCFAAVMAKPSRKEKHASRKNNLQENL